MTSVFVMESAKKEKPYKLTISITETLARFKVIYVVNWQMG
jgi:hypothetical protein